MKKILFVLPLTACLLATGCRQQAEEPEVMDTLEVKVEALGEPIDLDLIPMTEENQKRMEVAVKLDEQESEAPCQAATPRKVSTPAKPATKPAAKPVASAKDNGKAETIYVETDDAHGRVWGHVTMKGDRGTGTVHDEGENTWTVTVTRHGNELFAVDQNSRQYVFKLKNK